MIQTIYMEKEVAEHPRTQQILSRFPEAKTIPCDRYGEIFNRRAQNFRLQKRRPALILAKKHGKLVLETPTGYAIGSKHNFYFSHMMNCLYDCRYCFLQGMYRSANYVLFVNYEDFHASILEIANSLKGKPVCFFSGYDCDSLALEPVTGFVSGFSTVFRNIPNAWLELRTKSTQIRTLLEQPPWERCIVAYTLTPSAIADAVEHKAPSMKNRLQAMIKLQQRGWLLGLRFDPLIYVEDYKLQYSQLFESVFSVIKTRNIHSVSLGTFRLPKSYYRNLERLYPDDKLLAGPFAEKHGTVTYRAEVEQEMISWCRDELMKYIPEHLFFPCV